MNIAFCSLSILLLLPVLSPAESAITCHCFTERSYDPSKPSLADPYFLATAQNSFFAALFNVEKKAIVMKKQAGDSADHLWVAYWVASKSGRTSETVLAAKGKNRSWKSVIATMGITSRTLGEPLAAEVAKGASDARLSQLVVDAALLQHRLLGEQELVAMRKERASNQEIIMTVLIAIKTKKSAIRIYREVKSGTKSWGRFLSDANIQAGDIQSVFVALLK